MKTDPQTRYSFGMYYRGALPYPREIFRRGGPLPADQIRDDKQGKSDPPRDETTDGGWNIGGDTWEANPYSTNECHLDRRDTSDGKFTVEDFVKEYVMQGKPVVLYGDGLIEGDAW
jgi:hypothetical protein